MFFFKDQYEGKLKAIDFETSVVANMEPLSDTKCTCFYTPPELSEFFLSDISANASREQVVDEKYDGWGVGMIIVKMFENKNYFAFERNGDSNHKRYAKSLEHKGVLERIREETFLPDLRLYINNNFQYEKGPWYLIF